MLTISQIKSISRNLDIVPAKSKGQNFLFDQNIIQKIVNAADITSKDVILEVGPGLGALTQLLVKRAKQVICVELDVKIYQYLKQQYLSVDNLKLVQADILEVDLAQLGLKDRKYKLVANLPYNITAHFFRTIFSQTVKPSSLTLMLQKEVTDRLVTIPGQMSLLAVVVQYYARPQILFKVSPTCFWPKPKVESAVMSLKLRENLPNLDENRFFKLVKAGFLSKRKQLQNNLANYLQITKCEAKDVLINLGLSDRVRAQDLAVEDWLKLYQQLYP